MNSSRLFARTQTEPSGLNGELALRYGAATLVTLVALAAAQLVLPTKFMLLLGVITLLGVPVSLWMRLHDMRIGGFIVPRPLWNALTVTASMGASAFFLRVPLTNMLSVVRDGFNDSAYLRIGATEPMLLLVQLFLVFAAFRSFALINDKDATLATVPSFSVLLLLIPVYPNIEVVCYFIVWTLVATMLFALDHRSEIHAQVTAIVPAPAPGQDVKLAARSLAGVLGISLVAAVSLSGLLTARDPRDGSSSESAISLLAMRLTQFSFQSESSSSNSGMERQIDFSAPTSLPTRAVLWRINAFTLDGQQVTPIYWRLFTLSQYDGAVWSQSSGNLRAATKQPLTEMQWPKARVPQDGGVFEGRRLQSNRRQSDFVGSPPRNNLRDGSNSPRFSLNGDKLFIAGAPAGFDISKAQPHLVNSFGRPSQTVRYYLTAARTTLGFLPLLPAPRALDLRQNEQETLRVRDDGGVDVSIIASGQLFRAVSQVPKVAEYGLKGKGPPLKKSASSQQPPPQSAPVLSASEREMYLQLPAKLPARVRQFARDATRNVGADASNYVRAQILARATQKGAIYTLRPPQIPAGRDAADFFLFESRRGYCTYFAGALTVLCRAQGIPARVVSGFVAPEVERNGLSLIRDANAHAWTEIWVEGWGWATVDATPSDDRGDNAPTLLENWGDMAAALLDNSLRWALVHWVPVAAGVALIAFIFGGWRFRQGIARRRGRTITEETELTRRQIAADYARAARGLARRFRPRHAWETPDEWLRAARVVVPQLPFEPLQTLTNLYVRAHFSPLDLGANAPQQSHQARTEIVWPKRRNFSFFRQVSKR